MGQKTQTLPLLNLLLVEDSPAQAAILTDALLNSPSLKNEVEIKHSANCKDAFHAFLVDERAYDLIILDVNLPDGSGLDLCRKFREAGLPRVRRTGSGALELGLKIIILSESRLANLRKTAFEAGADYCVTKGGTDHTTLIMYVQAVLLQKRRNLTLSRL